MIFKVSDFVCFCGGFLDYASLLLPSWERVQEILPESGTAGRKKGPNDYISKVQQYICGVPLMIYCFGLTERRIQRSARPKIWYNLGDLF